MAFYINFSSSARFRKALRMKVQQKILHPKLKGFITQPTLSTSQIHHDFIINADKRDLNIIAIIYNKHFTCSGVKNKWKLFEDGKAKNFSAFFPFKVNI